MNSTGSFRPWHLLLLCLLAVPFTAKSQEINVNSSCEVGCPPGPALGNGQSNSGSFNFDYTFGDGDEYNLSGQYGASYSSVNGSTILFDPVATYIGSVNTTTLDTLTVDMLQSYFDNSSGSWAGNYTETIPIQLSNKAGSGSTVTAQLLYDGDSVGLAGPYSPGANLVFTETTALNFGTANDNAPTLSADYNFVFNFAAGTQPGASISSTPEPAMMVPCGLCLALLVYFLRRSRVPTENL